MLFSKINTLTLDSILCQSFEFCLLQSTCLKAPSCQPHPHLTTPIELHAQPNHAGCYSVHVVYVATWKKKDRPFMMTDIIRSLADTEKDLAYDYLCRLEEAKKLVKYNPDIITDRSTGHCICNLWDRRAKLPSTLWYNTIIS